MKYILRFLVFLLAITALVSALAGGGFYLWNKIQQGGEQESDWLSDANLSATSIERMIIGLYLRYRQDDIDRPASDDNTLVPFTIEPGETAVTIATQLAAEGLINDAELFRLYIRYHGVDAQLEAGDFELRRNMTMEKIVEALQQARMKEVTVTVLPGWRAEEIADMLEREEVMRGEAFLALVRQGTFAYAILADRPTGSSLEGYLFPETYRLPAQATALDLVERMLKTFEQRFTPEMRQTVRGQGMTIYEAVTMASIVQREAVVPDEGPIIASVYLNRLKEGMYLQADPTVQYAMGYQPDTGQWWKSPMKLDEYANVQSPYNTYLNPDLPPGPICSPSQAALEAVAFPADTNYLFFYAKGDGTHVFAVTYEEHQANIARYGGQ